VNLEIVQFGESFERIFLAGIEAFDEGLGG
jgi:hypothetical protein